MIEGDHNVGQTLNRSALRQARAHVPDLRRDKSRAATRMAPGQSGNTSW